MRATKNIIRPFACEHNKYDLNKGIINRIRDNDMDLTRISRTRRKVSFRHSGTNRPIGVQRRLE